MSNQNYYDPTQPIQMFFVCFPGLEPQLLDEVRGMGISPAKPVKGGIEALGSWSDVWRANLMLRGSTRVLVRIAEFSAVHMSQLDKRSRAVEWLNWLPENCSVHVEASANRSKLYHSGAIEQRVRDAVGDVCKGTVGPSHNLYVRIERDWCTISLDTSGDALHKRGGKLAVGKAPMRETMASLFLRAAGYQPGEALYDPMCGSGTFVLEAAGISAGAVPGLYRDFALEHLPSFEPEAFADLKHPSASIPPQRLFFGTDRDAGSVRRAGENAVRQGLDDWCQFSKSPIAAIEPPCEQPGLVICNPPYGDRIGEKWKLSALYGAFGKVMLERFSGWRIAMITNEERLAKDSKLPWQKPGPIVSHGGLKVRLWQTDPLT